MYKKVIRDTDGEKYINICHHCGNNTPQKVLYKYIGNETVYASDGEPIDINCEYRLVECGTCEQVMLYYKPEYENEDLFGTVIYPSDKGLPDSVPNEVRKAYNDASIISKLSPNAFAVQIRRALEFICKDKKIKGKNLCQMIENLAMENMIPPVLSEMTDGLRILGNYSAHASDIEFTPEDVILMDDFFKAILEYLYIAPNKIEIFRKRLNEIKNKTLVRGITNNK